jgi:hypothetical protein
VGFRVSSLETYQYHRRHCEQLDSSSAVLGILLGIERNEPDSSVKR